MAGNGHGSNVSCSACGEGLVCPFAATLQGLKTGTVTESALAAVASLKPPWMKRQMGGVVQTLLPRKKPKPNQRKFACIPGPSSLGNKWFRYRVSNHHLAPWWFGGSLARSCFGKSIHFFTYRDRCVSRSAYGCGR